MEVQRSPPQNVIPTQVGTQPRLQECSVCREVRCLGSRFRGNDGVGGQPRRSLRADPDIRRNGTYLSTGNCRSASELLEHLKRRGQGPKLAHRELELWSLLHSDYLQ